MIWLIIGLVALAVLLKPEALLKDEVLLQFKNKWFNTAYFWGQVYNVPVELVLAVIYSESRGKPQAKGQTGDWGLMQITQGCLTDYNTHHAASYILQDLINDPSRNVDVGTWYLHWLHTIYGLDWTDTLRAYNAGIGNVLKSKEAGENYALSVLEIQKRLEMV